MTVDDHVQAEQHERCDQDQAGHPNGVTRIDQLALRCVVLGGLLVLATLHPKEQRHSHHRREEDEFLADRVDPPIVEDGGVHHVGGVPLRHAPGVDDVPVHAVVVAEARQRGEPPHQQGSRPGGTGDEHEETRGSAHRSRLRTLPRASRTISG